MLREGALTVSTGRPPVGKSLLVNELADMNRAIVTEVQGTTQDVLEAVVSLEGRPIRLVDTAGLRESSDRPMAPSVLRGLPGPGLRPTAGSAGRRRSCVR